MEIPDIAKPINNLVNLRIRKIYIWVKQLYLYLFLSNKPIKLLKFENKQNELINNVPTIFEWDAVNFYKVLINGVDVTFAKKAVFHSSDYPNSFEIKIYGKSKTLSHKISLNVINKKIINEELKINDELIKLKKNFNTNTVIKTKIKLPLLKPVSNNIIFNEINTKNTSFSIKNEYFTKERLKENYLEID